MSALLIAADMIRATFTALDAVTKRFDLFAVADDRLGGDREAPIAEPNEQQQRIARDGRGEGRPAGRRGDCWRYRLVCCEAARP